MPADYQKNAAVDHLRAVPFVQQLTLSRAGDRGGASATITVKALQGEFVLAAEESRSLLTRAAVNEYLSRVTLRDWDNAGCVLLARHISRPTGERLVAAGVNFADEAGNLHLRLGDRYSWTHLGKPAVTPQPERRGVTAAQIQMLTQFVTHPDSLNWPVRRLESATGLGKSRIAQARQELVTSGLLARRGKQYILAPRAALTERITSGYLDMLRSRLFLGRFRSAAGTSAALLQGWKRQRPAGVRYALTGGAAVEILQKTYRGYEVPVFVDGNANDAANAFGLLPDRNGPVLLLRAFGDVVFWKEHDGHMVAPPVLVYAELLNSDDPRDIEAAGEFRQEFLP